MRLAATLPAVVKVPPATTSPFGATASARTLELKPVPSGNHATAFQRAMSSAPMPPAVVNEPAAYRSPLPSTVSALTGPSVPVPTGVHAVPLQRATYEMSDVPPAKSPPATRSPFGSVVTASIDAGARPKP